MNENVLTIEEVRATLKLDDDYDLHELEDLSSTATSFIKTKTKYVVRNGVVNPLAKQLAKLYIKSIFYGKAGYDLDEHNDYSIGITSLIKDLENEVLYGGEVK